MSEFKEGQKVWCFLNGWGKVDHVDKGGFYCVGVMFEDGGYDSFTEDGKSNEDFGRTLFFKEIPIPEDALVPPVEETTLNVGDIVALTDGRIVYVESYSDDTNKVFFCHSKIPQSFEEAFGPTSVQKSLIRKVMGNLNS
ncbi:hypothetical protein D3C87_324360 [compost metagenome]